MKFIASTVKHGHFRRKLKPIIGSMNRMEYEHVKTFKDLLSIIGISGTFWKHCWNMRWWCNGIWLRDNHGILWISMNDMMVGCVWKWRWNKYPLVIWHNYWKWPFIADLPIKHGDFPSFFVCLPEVYIYNPKWQHFLSEHHSCAVDGRRYPPWRGVHIPQKKAGEKRTKKLGPKNEPTVF